MKAPDRIWYDPESHTIVLEKKRTMDWDVEYIRNDADAMREARLVTYEDFEAAKIAASNNYKAHRRILREVMQLNDQLATTRNDALEEAARRVEKSVSQGVNREKLGDYVRAMKETE